MTANPYERAVIEAARSWRKRRVVDHVQDAYFYQAIDALIAHEASLAPGIIVALDWHLVVEGDELRGANGKFYPVVRTLKVRRGLYEIVVQLPTGPKVLTRPTEKDPAATVRRGATGQAVDQFVHVFSSNAGRRP